MIPFPALNPSGVIGRAIILVVAVGVCTVAAGCHHDDSTSPSDGTIVQGTSHPQNTTDANDPNASTHAPDANDPNASTAAPDANDPNASTAAPDANDPNASQAVTEDKNDANEAAMPDNMKSGKVRFARLKYDCQGWDDGMDANTAADINFLDYFRNLPSVNFPVARKGEAYTMRQFMSLPKGFKPAFIYMTGSGKFDLSAKDTQRVREYIKEGGMIFADAGSAQWDKSFTKFTDGLFARNPLKAIADDDALFARPFGFPKGPPPLWRHGGKKCKGVRFKGRWAVFYHPGDLNDAWKTGHSGLSKRLARESYRVGVNVLWYSFTHYLAETREYRK
jgi:hypothetical protein